jgi:hypothetical protein
MKLIDKDKVAGEIEKRLKEYRTFPDYQTDSNYMELCEILSFLNTLEVKEVEEETISEDLERAALLHYPKMSRISEPHGFIPADNKSHYLGDANEDNRKAFIVGAQWQKQQNATETKEVNLEKELERLDNILFDLDGVAIAGATHYLTVEDVKDIAKRFFELGLKKGE